MPAAIRPTMIASLCMPAIRCSRSSGLSAPNHSARFGVPPQRALWFGALNPLLLLHLIAGMHNDAIMVGLMAAGIYAAVRHHPALGAALVTAAALIKAPA